MEVHHHSHSTDPDRQWGRKKWTHYFWEFFMLFLAVTLGFFVENQREHYVEHLREKQFMKLMIADLQADTAEMNSTLKRTAIRTLNIDSMLMLLTAEPVTKEAIIKSYHHTYPALNNLTFTFSDRTITQLKNSGNMRIIRNQKVNDAIIHYWHRIDFISQAVSRHTAYRTKGRDLETKIFNVAKLYFKNDRRVDVSSEIQLIPNASGLWREYANVVAYCGVMLGSLQGLISDQGKLAKELMELINKEYHLE